MYLSYVCFATQGISCTPSNAVGLIRSVGRGYKSRQRAVPTLRGGRRYVPLLASSRRVHFECFMVIYHRAFCITAPCTSNDPFVSPQPWLRLTFLRATGQTNNSTTSMVSSVVQRKRIMLRLIAQQRQALTLEAQGASQESDPGAQRRKHAAEASLVYEDHDET